MMGRGGQQTMKQRRHTSEQVIRKLAEGDKLLAEDKTTEEVARHLEVSEQTRHRWRNQHGGMKANVEVAQKLWTRGLGSLLPEGQR
jgi:transposase-like protein